MKKILAVLVCALVVFTLACCTSENDNKDVNNNSEQSEQKKDEVIPETHTAEKETPKVELDIKPLGEIGEEELSAAAEKNGFENKSLFHAFANAIGKNPAEVTRQDIDKVHYIAIGPEDDGAYTLYIGYVDYVDLCLSEAATEENVLQQLNEIVMMSEFNYTQDSSFSDLGNFRNVEMFELYETKFEDVSFVAKYDKLIFGYFKNNGITDVSSLADYNPESLIELDLTGNDITDWSYLEHIKEKVLVFYDMSSGVSINLESYLEQKNNPVPDVVPDETTEAPAEKTDKPVLVDENGNPADFSSLFD